MKITATRRLQYAIGHRVFRHEGKCKDLHGHNFVFFLTAEAHHPVGAADPTARVDELGRVIDFGVLKRIFDSWFTMHWDHGMVLWKDDDEAVAAVRGMHSKLFLLPWNPTAENLARYMLEVVGPNLLEEYPVQLIRVEVHETENGIAVVEL